MSVIAVIGGTGVYDPSMFDNLEEKSMNTPYGEIHYTKGSYKNKPSCSWHDMVNPIPFRPI